MNILIMDINNFDSFFTNYFSNLQDNDKHSVLENTHHDASIHNNLNTHHNTNTDHTTNTDHKKSHQDNRLIIDQLNNSKTVYNSVHLQFIFYFIATCILVGFIFIINMSGNLSIFIIILLLIILFLIFKFLRFNIFNFLTNFKI